MAAAPESAATDAAPIPQTQAETGLPPEVPYELTAEKMFKDTFVFLALMFAIFYFLLIRPQQKRLKAHETLLKDLKKGDKVATNGGILGTVVKLEGDDVAVIEVAQGVRIRVEKSAVSSRIAKDSPLSATANDN